VVVVLARDAAHAGDHSSKKKAAASSAKTLKAPSAVSEESSAAARIRAALETPTIIEFVETPLADIVEYLKDYHNIEIQLDKKALDDHGVGADTPITRNLRGISLKSALALILRNHNLTTVIDNEVLMITTNEAAGQRRELAIYNVAGLIKGDSTEQLAEVVRQSLVPSGSGDAETIVTPYREVLIVQATQENQRRLTELLRQLHRALDTPKDGSR
jgi:hypothetical protein